MGTHLNNHNGDTPWHSIGTHLGILRVNILRGHSLAFYVLWGHTFTFLSVTIVQNRNTWRARQKRHTTTQKRFNSTWRDIGENCSSLSLSLSLSVPLFPTPRIPTEYVQAYVLAYMHMQPTGNGNPSHMCDGSPVGEAHMPLHIRLFSIQAWSKSTFCLFFVCASTYVQVRCNKRTIVHIKKHKKPVFWPWPPPSKKRTVSLEQ